jgi:DNA-directed RNA polymerase I subunit RPA2
VHIFRSALSATIELRVNGNYHSVFNTVIGYVPIMMCSTLCHLSGLSEEEMIKAGEERLERGGYFICKGSEKVIRLLVGNKRNYPIALVRNSSKEKGKMFTEFRYVCIKFLLSVTNYLI